MLAGGRDVILAPMGESVDDSRSAEELQPEAEEPSDFAEPAEAELVSEPEPPRDDYVPV